MRILIDTHILIWHLEGNNALTQERRELVADSVADVSVSIASFWEIGIKVSLGKLSLASSLADILCVIQNTNITILPIDPKHVIAVSTLPFHHKDPFDRLIVAQALEDDLTIMTSDPEFQSYGVKLL